jgi:hypothetical protein
LFSIYFEASTLKKDQKSLATIGQLKSNQEARNELYEEMRHIMKPKSKLDLFFDVKGRHESIKKAIECFGYTVSAIQYKGKHGYYKSEDESYEFPFYFEVAIVATSDLPCNLLYVEGINSSPQPHYSFLVGPAGTFSWQTRNNNKTNSSSNIFEILERYGYSHDPGKCKKPKSIVMVNLFSPRIDYKSYGKSDIDLKPFAGTVASTVYKAFSRSLVRSNNTSESGNRPLTAEALLVSLLTERLRNIEKIPSLMNTDRWTQSTVYYRLRPLLIAKGINVSRRYITTQIRSICEEKLRKHREELGIIAADRAQLFFRGRWHDVGLDELPQLMHLGTDLLIIEKEGVAGVMCPFADKKGIALLNTRGFLTEYATMLSDLSREDGCNVVILTDFDASGLLLAKKVTRIYRIGIDFDTLDYFGLTPEQVEEEYKPDNSHIKPLEVMASDSLAEDENDDSYVLNDYLKFVNRKRIEIDSFLVKVGNEMFWDFIIHKIDEKFPTRDCNRSVNVPEYAMPPVLEELNRRVNNKMTMILATKRHRIISKLSKVKGFIDPEQKEEEIKDTLMCQISSNKDMQQILTRIGDLIVECKL